MDTANTSSQVKYIYLRGNMKCNRQCHRCGV